MFCGNISEDTAETIEMLIKIKGICGYSYEVRFLK